MLTFVVGLVLFMAIRGYQSIPAKSLDDVEPRESSTSAPTLLDPCWLASASCVACRFVSAIVTACCASWVTPCEVVRFRQAWAINSFDSSYRTGQGLGVGCTGVASSATTGATSCSGSGTTSGAGSGTGCGMGSTTGSGSGAGVGAGSGAGASAGAGSAGGSGTCAKPVSD